MITDRDITKLKQVFATKDELQEVRENMADKNDIKEILLGIDKLALRYDTHDLEIASLKISDSRQNRQLKQIADTINIKLEE